MANKVWVEMSAEGLAVRIFRNKKMAALYSVMPSHGLTQPTIREMQRPEAVIQIRRQVYKRDGGQCVRCGDPLLWESGYWNSAEMDERKARGTCTKEDGHYKSGEVSVENCQILCRKCHTGPGGKHDRAPSFHRTEAIS